MEYLEQAVGDEDDETLLPYLVFLYNSMVKQESLREMFVS